MFCLNRESVPNRRHVLEINRRAVHRFDRQVVHLADNLGTIVQANRIFGIAHLDGAGRQDQVLKIERVRDVDGRQLLGVKRVRVQIHYHLALLAAVRAGHRGALNGGQRGPDEVLRQVINLLLAQGLAFQPQLQDRHAGRVVLQDIGWKDSRRHGARG